jgi:oxygen-independent coproporphyrinogen-3 oxidase
MSGLYLHIPFCKQACHYCDFHFSTSMKYKGEVTQAIVQELILRKDYLEDKHLSSVYFGGGTPSLLDEEELAVLFETIKACFVLDADAEITLEANPDDITEENLARWQASPINRLSIGIQSFADADLTYMNRAHNAVEARRCIAMAQSFGFKNLTVDLIYGTPTMPDITWENNVQTLIDAGVPHLSCYALTVEPKTALAYQIKTGKSQEVEEEQAARQFEMLMRWLGDAGYEHYEISNFALPGHRAVHNSNYWLASHYLGVGPSAHSFNGHSRQWNIANNAKYLKSIAALKEDQEEATEGLYEIEKLSPADQYNEYILTGLRTSWGVTTDKMAAPFKAYFIDSIHQFVNKGLVFEEKSVFVLTKEGRLLADRIASDLFFSG